MPSRIWREDVHRLLSEGAQLVEVLGADEYGEAHLPGAINIPLDELTPDVVRQLDRGRPVITYCYDTQCDMSPRAAWRLEALGFSPVYHYAPGKADWLGAGLPIEGEAADMAFVGSLARGDVPVCSLTTPVSEIRALLEGSEWDTCFVTNEQEIVLGRVYRSRLEHAGAGRAIAEHVMDPGPSTYRPDIPALEMARRMREEELTTAPITTSDGRLIGVVLRRDVESAVRSRPQGKLSRGNPAASHERPRVQTTAGPAAGGRR